MNYTLDKLLESKCAPISHESAPLNLTDIEHLRELTPNWQYCATENVLSQTFHFDHYSKVIEVVNLIAKVADKEDHHPDMYVSYGRCKVSYSTHSVNGITINDFICAAKVDQLV